MIQKATVRRARMTGYQKKNRSTKGNIYLKKEWIGKHIMVMEHKEYSDLRFEAKATKFRKQIAKLIKRLERIKRITL